MVYMFDNMVHTQESIYSNYKQIRTLKSLMLHKETLAPRPAKTVFTTRVVLIGGQQPLRQFPNSWHINTDQTRPADVPLLSAWSHKSSLVLALATERYALPSCLRSYGLFIMPHLGPIHQPSRLLKLDGFLDKDWDLEKTVNSGSDFEESGV